ncbi:MAG: ECF transporter S component [Ruminococcaceae bacterium]|nr:ECF transporter S component [Oscillospiraceae bacterium]
MVLVAMLAAVAYLLVFFIRIPVVLFLSYEPKDVVITIGGFLLGPMAAFAASVVVSLVEMLTISTTGPIGCVMNLLSTCSFACIAALIYKKRHNLAGAVLGLLAGSAAMVITMLLWNYLITPLYMTGTSRADVAAMLVPIFLPFNLLKAGFNAALTLLLYKPLVTALRRTGLVERKSSPAGKSKLGLYVFAGILLITCILLLLVLQGKI